MRALLIAISTAGLVVACATRPPATIVSATGDAELVETSVSGTSPALTAADYQTEAAKRASDPAFVAIRTKPGSLGARARFGIGILDRNACWAIDGDAASGYTLYGDFNANGDLTDDAPRRFEDEKGKPTVRVTMTGHAGNGEPYPVRMKMHLDMVALPGVQGRSLALVRYATMRRRGDVHAGSGRPIPFRITGPNGLFAVSYASIAFDVNRDGTFDPDIERYELSERYVNLEGVTYEIGVEPHGNRVTLTPASHRQDRLALKTGYAAPDFAFVDLTGATRHLSDFRGKVVLLDFWGVWCPSCVANVPELVRLYDAYHSRGFEIIGIETRDTREKVMAFTDSHHMPWTQTLEQETGPATTRYRVTGWPTAFLVGADGRFLAANYLGEVDLAAELQKVFPDSRASR